MATARKAERQPWNRSTRLNEAPKRSTKSGDEDTETPADDVVTATNAVESTGPSGRPRRSGRATTSRTTARPTMLSNRARHPIGRDGEDNGGKQDEREQTRTMIERAVSAALGTVLTDRSSSFERDDVGINSIDDEPDRFDKDTAVDSYRQPHDKENSQTQQRQPPVELTPAAFFCGRKVPEVELASVLDKQEALRDTGRRRRDQHQQSNAQTQREARNKREFYRRLNAAAVEFHARKHAIQSLYERVQREIQYLAVTASDLDKRQLLLEDAFASYELALRAKYDQQEEQEDS